VAFLTVLLLQEELVRVTLLLQVYPP